MTDEQARALSDCGRGCYIIGGPWISYDPDCPLHGKDARQKESTPSELDEAVRLLTEVAETVPNMSIELEQAINAYLAKAKK